MSAERYDWFSVVGIEIEYAIVDRQTLAVRPLADQVLRQGARAVNELCQGELCWSNELVAHVIELKSNGPVSRLEPLPGFLRRDATRIDALLAPHAARLMPSAMHPLMDPARDTQLWPHEQNDIYAAFDRVFDCRRHGWANLQSMHVNLPFDGDAQFGRLHAAIRVLLPLLPALAASSPFVEGRPTALLDNRLGFYGDNCARIPSITGRIIPEALFDEASYRRQILDRIAQDVAAYDTDGVFEADWVNARGAIARFDRGSIEIRVIDTQECPSADLAVAALGVAAVRALAEEHWSSYELQKSWTDERLESVLLRTMAQGSEAVIDVPEYLALFGLDGAASARDVWRRLTDALVARGLLNTTAWTRPLELFFRRGCLASRLLAAAGPAPSRAALTALYLELATCLTDDRSFDP